MPNRFYPPPHRAGHKRKAAPKAGLLMALAAAAVALAGLTGCATTPTMLGGKRQPAKSSKSKAPAKSGTPSFPWSPDDGMANAARVIGKRPPRTPAHEMPLCARNGGMEARGKPAFDSGRLPVNFVSYDVCSRAGQTSGRGFCWPVAGKVSRPFCEKTNHRGIDILAPEGTPIHAAKDGTVIYSGDKLAGYGNLIIIDHGGGVASVYGHNRCNLVRLNQKVRRGQVIAEVGQTGRATAPHVHFEVREGSKAVDPRKFLP